MKEKVITGVNGKKIIFLTPETPEEEEELRIEVRVGTISDKNSFGDFKELPKKEREMKEA